MKKTLFILCLLLTSLGLNAQILPVEQLKEVTTEEKSSFYTQAKGITHIKDVNGVLNKFVGTWKGSFNGKQLELVVKKYTVDYSPYIDRESHPEDLLWDQLIGKWAITDQNGTVIYSTLNESDHMPDDEPPKLMYKDSYRSPLSYDLHYQGKNYKCGDNGYVSLYIKSNTQNSKMYFVYLHKGSVSSDCTSSVGAVFPINEGILLTKQ